MFSEIRVSGRSGVAVVDIEGVIGVPEKMQFEQPEQRIATYERFTRSLREIAALDASEVVVNIRSTGGDVNDALLIYEALTSLGVHVTTRCYGYVASAATIIAQAASPGAREISANSLYLIHCSESTAEGNSGSMSRAAELLDKTDARIAGIYAARSGRDVAGFAELMNENGGKGRWLSAEETVEAGLADEVTEPAVTNLADDAAVAEEIVRMLGLELIPGMEDVAEVGLGNAAGCAETAGGFPGASSGRFWGALRKFLGRLLPEVRHAGPETEEVAVEGSVEPCGSAAADTVVAMRHREAQAKATFTRTMPCEDPSHDEQRRSPNDAAYYEDSLNLKNLRA